MSLHLSILLLFLFFSPAISLTLNQTLPIRQFGSSSICPCQCRAVSPKGPGFCPRGRGGCRISRCSPRKRGFTCCDRVPLRVPPVAPSSQVTGLYTTVDNNARVAVQEEPELSEQIVAILLDCAERLNAVGREIEGQDLDVASRGVTMRMRRLSQRFIAVRDASVQGSLQFASRLVLHQ